MTINIAKRPGVRQSFGALTLQTPSRLHLLIHDFQFLTALGLLAWLLGCASTASHSNAPIDQLHLIVTSVALDLDGKPGPDGVGVRVYASRSGSNEAVPIKTGTLELMMYDGAHVRDKLAALQPRHTWTYPADKLKSYIQQTSIGTSYRFAALWGDDKPSGDRVTLIGRYTGPDAKQVFSAPSSIPVSK